MVTEIRWSANALRNYNKIIDYLVSEWGEMVAAGFIENIEDKISNISQNPYVGKASAREKHIRSLHITKHNRLYYRMVKAEILEIVNIFDTRQHPDKNQYK